MATAGIIAARVTADTSNFQKGMRNSSKSLSGFSRSAGSMGGAMGLLKGGLIGLAAGAIAGGVAATKLAADAETTAVKFETLLGSANNAAKVMADLKQFAASTPFQFTELAEGSAKLLSFGVGVEDLQGRVKTLGDIAAGSGSRFGELASIFGKIKSSGTASLGDINQFGDRGIPIFAELEKVTGKSGTELKKFISAGNVGFPTMLQALQNMTSKGGMFFNAMDKQSKTLAGTWSTLMDNVTELGTAIGSLLVPILKPIVAGLTSMVQNVRWLLQQAGLAEKAVPKTFEKIHKKAAAAVAPIKKVNAELVSLMEKGKSIEMEFRTPDQVFQDRITELNKLVEAGAIQWNTYDRAVNSASMRLMEATKQQEKMNKTRSPLAGVTALVRGSSEAYSTAAARNRDRGASEILDENKQQTKLLQRIADAQERAGVIEEPIAINEVTIG